MKHAGLRLGLAVTAVSAALLLAGALGWVLGTANRPANGSSGTLPELGRAPDYQGLSNQLGQTVGSRRFRGKVQLVTFEFAYCRTYCPLITAHLVGLERALRGTPLEDRVELVSFNVDPAGTRPPQMRAFLEQYGWDPHDPHWQYLTGKPETIRHIVTDGFHVFYQKVSDDEPSSGSGPAQTPQPEVSNPLADRVQPGYDVTHNDALIVVGPQGEIRRIFDQADVLSSDRLLRIIRSLV